MIFRWTIWGVLFVSSLAWGGILNSDFESANRGDPFEFFMLGGTSQQVFAVEFWQRESFVYQFTSFAPQPAHGQNTDSRPENDVTWSIPSPIEGNYFAVLSTEDIHQDPTIDGDIKLSKITQDIFITARSARAGRV